MSMLIRKLGVNDATTLQRLRKASDTDGTLGSLREREEALAMPQILHSLAKPFRTIGAFAGRTLVGAATVSPVPNDDWELDNGKWLGLSGVIVSPPYRGQGVGRTLVQACIHAASDGEFEGMLLEVNEPNPSARRLYDSLGFTVWSGPSLSYTVDGAEFYRVCMKRTIAPNRADGE